MIMIPVPRPKAGLPPGQLHTSIGMINGSYAGATSNTFSISQSLNLEYEIFYNTRMSYVARAQIAIDPTTGKMVYYGGFLGSRYYFKSTGMIFDNTTQDITFRSIPKWRFYMGWDVGIAQVVVAEVGPSLTALSTMLDFGGHVGSIYQLGKTWGIDVQLGYSYGYGFSTVSVTGTAMKLWVGGVYYFD